MVGRLLGQTLGPWGHWCALVRMSYAAFSRLGRLPSGTLSMLPHKGYFGNLGIFPLEHVGVMLSS